jgi:hypothetical protein
MSQNNPTNFFSGSQVVVFNDFYFPSPECPEACRGEASLPQGSKILLGFIVDNGSSSALESTILSRERSTRLSRRSFLRTEMEGICLVQGLYRSPILLEESIVAIAFGKSIHVDQTRAEGGARCPNIEGKRGYERIRSGVAIEFYQLFAGEEDET